MDRFRLAACGVAAVVALSGCSAGQVAQTATQDPAINGTALNLGSISLRNVHLRAEQVTDFVQPGSEVELLFQASNESPEVADRLLSITSDIGTVTLTGNRTVPASGVLSVGAPDGQITALESVETAEAAEAMVTLTEPITNGLLYDFTFTFEQSGQGTVAVPISAGEAPPRREDAGASHEGGSGGH